MSTPSDANAVGLEDKFSANFSEFLFLSSEE